MIDNTFYRNRQNEIKKPTRAKNSRNRRVARLQPTEAVKDSLKAANTKNIVFRQRKKL